MSTTPADVLRYLASRDEPVDLRTMGVVLDTSDLNGLNYTLGNLVRSRQVKRHHNADGILRYSLMAGVVVPPPAPPSTTASARRFSTVERVRALLKEATRPLTAADACRALSGEKPEAVKSALYNGVASGEFASVEVPGQQAKTFEIKGRFTATATATASTPEAQATATATATAPPAPAPTPAPARVPKAAKPKVSTARAVRQFIKDAGRPVTAEQLIEAMPERTAASLRSALHEGVRQKHLISRPIAGTHAKEYLLEGQRFPPAAVPGLEAGGDELEHAVVMAEAALQRYVESCVDQHVYQLLRLSVSAAKAARDRHAPESTP